jgi:uracil-DNA glycosylase
MLPLLHEEIVACTRCPRLVAWREHIGREKRRAYMDWSYWARPVPGFGDAAARLLVLGLAPAAHGANRTGRVFTGDRSGDWLFAALHRAGYANQPTSVHREDGLRLHDAFVTAAVRCAPPENKPSPEERESCIGYLVREMQLLPSVRVVLCLGGFAWDAALRTLRRAGVQLPRPAVRFGHNRRYEITPDFSLLGSYHPSQQNTFTGRLTEAMLDEVFAHARAIVECAEGEAPVPLSHRHR